MFKGLRNTIMLLAALHLLSAAIGSDVAPGVKSAWPIYHGDAGLRGIASCTLPDKVSILWRYKVGSPVSLAPVSDGEKIYIVAENGEAYAISLKGALVWSAKISQAQADTNSYRRVEKFSSPPMVVQNTVFAGTDSGFLYALDNNTGRVKWTYKVGENIIGTANWMEPDGKSAASVVVISQTDSVTHRIDLETGRQVWITQPMDRCDASPGMGKDFFVFGNCEAALHIFSLANGKLAGKVKLNDDGQVAGGAAVDGNLVFAGTRGGMVVCADAGNYSIVWTNQITKSECFATPVVTGEKVITVANDGKVYCLDRSNGKLLWSFKSSGDPMSPAVAGDKVVVSSGGTLYILKAADGVKLWSDKPGDTISSPAVFAGKIVVGTDDGFVSMYGAGN